MTPIRLAAVAALCLALAGCPSEGNGNEDPDGSVETVGYLKVKGHQLVTQEGKVVQLTGINWFGLDSKDFAPHGLWKRSMDSILDQIKQLGYNVIRVPFCTQMLDKGSKPTDIDYYENTDLKGLGPLELLDKLVAKAAKRKLRIILDRHSPEADKQSALWYTTKYNEARWIADWKQLAERYKGNGTVIGFDLHNEPQDPATWGSGDAKTDWRLAAERAAEAILGVNDKLLIIVQGVQTADSKSYWWGGNLKLASKHPVRVKVPGRLVYSAHDYPNSVDAQPWFSDAKFPANLEPLWDEMWGYLVKKKIAPVLLGEFGTFYKDSQDQVWLKELLKYIDTNKINFTYWCLNPNSNRTGGILKDDWKTVETAKQSLLKPLLAPPIP